MILRHPVDNDLLIVFFISTKKPYIFAKEPYISTKEPTW